jgi:REP element-mobilizing transposase RayT
MPYDPNRHHRRSIRLRGWDYTNAGAYFVTICVKNSDCVLGEIVDGEMRLNAFGTIVAEYWQNLPQHFPTIELDAFVVMPNHVHFIVWLNPPDRIRDAQNVGAQNVEAQNVGAQNVGAQFNCAPTPPTPPAPTSPMQIGKRFTVDKQRPTLGQVIRAFKAATARFIHQAGGDGFQWQSNYYEHIIRDEGELHRIREYISNNPANWSADDENPNCIVTQNVGAPS